MKETKVKQDTAFRLLGFVHQSALSHIINMQMSCLFFILLTNTVEDQTNCGGEVKILLRENIFGYVKKKSCKIACLNFI